MLAAQQHIQQYSQRVDIRCDSDGATDYLFGGRVFGSQRTSSIVSQQRCGIGPDVIFNALCDAEVQQLYYTEMVDVDVGWVDVPMHNQVGMCMANGRQDVQEQTHPGFDAQSIFFAVAIDRAASYVFQDEVGLGGGGDSGVQNPCVVWL